MPTTLPIPLPVPEPIAPSTTVPVSRYGEPTKSAAPKSFRLAILASKETAPAWAATLLQNLKNRTWITPLVCGLPSSMAASTPVTQDLNQFVFRLDRKLHPPLRDAYASVATDALGVPRMPLSRAHADILILLEPRPALAAQLAASCQADVWWCEITANPDNAGVTCRLRSFTPGQGHAVTLSESTSAASPGALYANQNVAAWSQMQLINQRLHLVREGGLALSHRVKPRHISPIANRSPQKPPSLASHLANHCRQSLDHLLYTGQWSLLFREGESSFQSLEPPPSTMWADPFPFVHNGRHYVFFEQLRYKFWGRTTGSPGHIACIEYLGAGRWGKPFSVLHKPYHLSYPFVFEFESGIYMIPETQANHSLELYQATGFPHRWELRQTIFSDIDAADTTLLQHGGLWWMFTCLQDTLSGASNRDLHLFFTDNPITGHWTPHPLNPVVSDVRCARPAGRIFLKSGELHRPGQDCSRRYGEAIELRKILRLTETEYEEVPALRISPKSTPGTGGIHTWNQSGALTVADSWRKTARWRLC